MIACNRFFRLPALVLGTGLLAAPISALSDTGHQHREAIGEPAQASDADRTVQVTLADNFFEPESLQVRAGETVRFLLTNTGEFLHEFNIGTADMHAEHREEMAMMMDHGMITPTGIDPERMKMDHGSMGAGHGTHDEPNSMLVEPGQTAELIWRFTNAGELEFACNMPGHYEAGMVGNVEFVR